MEIANFRCFDAKMMPQKYLLYAHTQFCFFLPSVHVHNYFNCADQIQLNLFCVGPCSQLSPRLKKKLNIGLEFSRDLIKLR